MPINETFPEKIIRLRRAVNAVGNVMDDDRWPGVRADLAHAYSADLERIILKLLVVQGDFNQALGVQNAGLAMKTREDA